LNFVSDTVKRWYSSIDIIDRSKFLFSVSPKAVVVGRSLAVVLQSDECNGRKSDKCLNQKIYKNGYASTSMVVLWDPMVHPHLGGGPGHQRREHVVRGLRNSTSHSFHSL